MKVNSHSANLFRQVSDYGETLGTFMQIVDCVARPRSNDEREISQDFAADVDTLRGWATRLEADASLREEVPAEAFLAGFRVARTLETLCSNPVVGPMLSEVGIQGQTVGQLVATFRHFLDMLRAPVGLKA